MLAWGLPSNAAAATSSAAAASSAPSAGALVVDAFAVSAGARDEAVRRGEARGALCHACRRVSGRWPAQQSADGTYFIDRDPACFAIVMNHLRGDNVAPTIAALPPLLRAQLARDADFYGLEGLFEKAWGSAAWTGPGEARSAQAFAQGSKWTVKVKGAARCGNLVVGVQPEGQAQVTVHDGSAW
jgi:hypothetical protein